PRHRDQPHHRHRLHLRRPAHRGEGMRKGLLRALLSHKGGVLGMAFLAVVVLIAVFYPLYNPRSPWAIVARPFLPPMTRGYILGTDMLGRDLFLGLVHRARFSLLIGLLSTLVSLGIGVS